jgi:hypothetical protein
VLSKGSLRHFAGAIGLLVTVWTPVRAQDPGSHLGLTALAAVGLHAGFAQVERESDGREAGFLIDLGWMRGRSVRLQAEVSFLWATLTETVVTEDSTFTGDYFDLTGGVSAVWLASPGSQVSPYALAGLAVHALSSTFGSPVLDRRYNANRFGSHLGAGVRFRLGAESSNALYVEVRRTFADEVNRTAVRLGGLVVFGDLARRAAIR